MTAFPFFTEDASVNAVNARIGAGCDPRLALVMARLVHHLHAFVKDVGLTQDEWGLAIDFLTRTGQMCDANRQEYILLSDVLGVSMLVDAINNRRPAPATENTVLGPFHVDGVAVHQRGADLRSLKARDVMNSQPRTIRVDALAVEAADIMEQYRITSILVIDDAGHLCGAINTNDLMRAKVI